MPKLFLNILLIFYLITASLSAQEAFYAEYYFDFDPGPGQGTSVAATEGDSIFNFSANKSNLKPGFHIMYLRARDAAGRWTLHVLKPFFIPDMEIQDTTKADIVYAEYYFDRDPGFGNGVGMSLTASTNTEGSFNVDKSALKPGFHIFYIRAKDQYNSWTLHIAKPFLITAPFIKTQTSVNAIEYYFFKKGVPSDTFRVTDFDPGTDLEITFQPEFTNLMQDSTYDFHVYAIDSSGRRSLNFVFGDQVIDDIVEEELTALFPKTLELKANYPNPFNPTTTIKFGLPAAGNVKLVIYDILGRQVAELVNTKMQGGYHSVVWDGKNDLGRQVASGLYIYQVATNNKILSRKMIMVK